MTSLFSCVELLEEYDMVASAGRDYHFYITDAKGDGRERYDIMEDILEKQKGMYSEAVVWEALQAASQTPKPGDVTSNTQWSAVYDNTKRTMELCIRRNWNDVYAYNLETNTLEAAPIH